jgi:hypothetical protein
MAYLLWQGASVLDGAPIVLLATDSSKNGKTGPMAQTYILRADMHPQEAIKTDADSSICGDCRFRGKQGKGRMCYVNLRNGPYSVWRSFANGNAHQVPDLAKFGKGKLIRMGTYGDPAAVPFEVWEKLLSKSSGHTGYTHVWRTSDPRFQTIIQASCDHAGDYHEAKAMGWFTYRAKLPEEPRMQGERPCPAGGENKGTVTCADCLGCNGQRRDFSIDAHGSAGQVKHYREFRMTLET